MWAQNTLFVVVNMCELNLDVFGSTLDLWIHHIPRCYMVFSLPSIIFLRGQRQPPPNRFIHCVISFEAKGPLTLIQRLEITYEYLDQEVVVEC